jgi:hypothetical protein
MARAVKAVRDKKMGLLKASKMFNVPRATLKETGMMLVSTVSEMWTYVLRIGEEINGCATSNIPNGVTRRVQVDMKTALSSSALNFSENYRDLHVIYFIF